MVTYVLQCSTMTSGKVRLSDNIEELERGEFPLGRTMCVHEKAVLKKIKNRCELFKRILLNKSFPVEHSLNLYLRATIVCWQS